MQLKIGGGRKRREGRDFYSTNICVRLTHFHKDALVLNQTHPGSLASVVWYEHYIAGSWAAIHWPGS